MKPLKIISMDEVVAKSVKWLWYPYIPFGKITIIQGDPGEGKTTIALRLAALLSNGEKLPCDDTEREPMNVIYQTAEDGLNDTIKPRLVEAGADCTKIKVIDESAYALTMLDERLEQAIAETAARLVILDPIQAYLGADINMNSANETRAVMSRLSALAEKYQCAVVLVGHMNKGSGNKSSLAPEGEAIAFELNKEKGFRWIGHYDITVDDLLNGVSRENKSELAEQLIRDTLENGQVLQSEIMNKAKAQGISKRVMDEAKKALGVDSVRQGKLWAWRLPESE